MLSHTYIVLLILEAAKKICLLNNFVFLLTVIASAAV